MTTEPEHIGYKKVRVYTKSGELVSAVCKLRITGEHNEARTNVCNPDYAKYRCSEAFVLSIHRYSSSSGRRYSFKAGESIYTFLTREGRRKLQYITGTTVKPQFRYDKRIEKVCASGIHYFKTKRAAQEYFESPPWEKERQDCGEFPGACACPLT